MEMCISAAKLDGKNKDGAAGAISLKSSSDCE
jgi:hypothetical protein